jgi:hypothetical protein
MRAHQPNERCTLGVGLLALGAALKNCTRTADLSTADTDLYYQMDQ